MAVVLFSAAAVLVTTISLVFGLNWSKSEKKRDLVRKHFERQTGEKRTFAELREDGWFGFSHYYLRAKFNDEDLKTTALFEFVLYLVKLDLSEGAIPAEIVFGCCFGWPKRDVISRVIEETGAKIEDILKFENKDGYNCLMTMFNVLNRHLQKTGKDPAGSAMATEVEKSIRHLIKLGEKQNLDMNKVLKRPTKSGKTLLSAATVFAPNLASTILSRINAKSIDNKFRTPQFKFESLHRQMIAAGVNPYALSYLNRTEFDRYNVSEELIAKLNPGLTSDLFYSTTSLPCNDQNCDPSCKQGLPDPWYYNNGQVCDFKVTDRIREGGEATVFSGKFHGKPAAFKFFEIKNLTFLNKAPDVIEDLNERLWEMKKLSKTNGQNILPFYGHIRQQLSAEKVKELGLGVEVTRYEVYITKLCDFNLKNLKKNNGISIDEAKNIIDQLIDALEQLQAAGVSHNNIKPGNILVDHGDRFPFKIYIGDFGQADQLGGTPGWTPPEFMNPHVPGVSDMYSFGLVFLYVLCENEEVFYSIRDNFIADEAANQQWFLDLMNTPVIKLVQFMTEPDHKDRMTLTQLKSEWKRIRNSVRMIEPGQLSSLRRDDDFQNIKGPNLTLTKTEPSFTRTQIQGYTMNGWLSSLTSSLHHSMKLNVGISL